MNFLGDSLSRLFTGQMPAIQLLTLSKHLTELIGTDSDSVKDIADGPCVLS